MRVLILEWLAMVGLGILIGSVVTLVVQRAIRYVRDRAYRLGHKQGSEDERKKIQGVFR